jgi:hypothetical protein
MLATRSIQEPCQLPGDEANRRRQRYRISWEEGSIQKPMLRVGDIMLHGWVYGAGNQVGRGPSRNRCFGRLLRCLIAKGILFLVLASAGPGLEYWTRVDHQQGASASLHPAVRRGHATCKLRDKAPIERYVAS